MFDKKINSQAIQLLGDSLGKGRPIPGQSLTNSPDTPYKWEQPPELTNFKEGIHYIFDLLITPDVFKDVVGSLNAGVPVLDISSSMLYLGFTEGKWNPDLMLLLQEPTMYLIMAMGERAGIEKMRIYSGEEEEVGNLTDEEVLELAKEATSFKEMKPKQIREEVVPTDIKKELEELDVPSLLGKQEQTESLLKAR